MTSFNFNQGGCSISNVFSVSGRQSMICSGETTGKRALKEWEEEVWYRYGSFGEEKEIFSSKECRR